VVLAEACRADTPAAASIMAPNGAGLRAKGDGLLGPVWVRGAERMRWVQASACRLPVPSHALPGSASARVKVAHMPTPALMVSLLSAAFSSLVYSM
jgi:hypothetical protein